MLEPDPKAIPHAKSSMTIRNPCSYSDIFPQSVLHAAWVSSLEQYSPQTLPYFEPTTTFIMFSNAKATSLEGPNSTKASFELLSCRRKWRAIFASLLG